MAFKQPRVGRPHLKNLVCINYALTFLHKHIVLFNHIRLHCFFLPLSLHLLNSSPTLMSLYELAVLIRVDDRIMDEEFLAGAWDTYQWLHH